MTARKNFRRSANEPHFYATQHMGCVALPGPYWNFRRIASSSVLFVFVAILCAGVANLDFSSLALMPTKAQPVSEPYDIVLSGSANEADAIDNSGAAKKAQKEKSPAFEVTVGGDEGADVPESEAKAAHLARAAKSYLRQGDVRRAIVFQHRAVETSPDNMAYRLQLAVLHDRLSDAKGALMLYRQVVEAYENKDATLPSKLDIDHIKSRLDYLAAKADQ